MLIKHVFLKAVVLVLFILFISNGYILANCKEVLQSDKFYSISLMIAHGATGGFWHVCAEGIAGIIRKELPGSNITVIPGGSDANIAMLQRGEVDLAITGTDSAHSAINGWSAFPEPIPLKDVNTIAKLYDAKIQFVVLDNVGINSIEEIKKKKIPLKLSVGQRGSGMELGAKRILEEYGMTLEDIEDWGGRVVYFGPVESIRMMGDGQLNAYIDLTLIPRINLTELALKRNFKILPIRDDVVENMAKSFNYMPSIIPKGTYQGITEDIPTICVANGLFASGRLDEQVVYLVTKTLVDNIDNLSQIHSQLSNITASYMNKPIVFPVNPGAQRAYQEEMIEQ